MGQKLLGGVLGSLLGAVGWNSSKGKSSLVVSSLFTTKGSLGAGGRWKDSPAWGSRETVLRTVGEGEEGADCLGFPKIGLWVSLAKTEGEEVGTTGCGVEVTGGEAGRWTSVLSSSSGEESSLSLVRCVRIVPSVGFLLM